MLFGLINYLMKTYHWIFNTFFFLENEIQHIIFGNKSQLSVSDLRSDGIDHVEIRYTYNNHYYKLAIPITIPKIYSGLSGVGIIEAIVNDNIDITEYVEEYQGPQCDFYNLPLLVSWIVPQKYHADFKKLTIMNANGENHSYTDLTDEIIFHLRHPPQDVLLSENELAKTLKRLEYLNLEL